MFRTCKLILPVFPRTSLTRVQSVQDPFQRPVICGTIQRSTPPHPPPHSPFPTTPLPLPPHLHRPQPQISRRRGRPLPICSRLSPRKNLSPFSKRIDLILLFSEDLLMLDKIYIYEESLICLNVVENEGTWSQIILLFSWSLTLIVHNHGLLSQFQTDWTALQSKPWKKLPFFVFPHPIYGHNGPTQIHLPSLFFCD